MCNCKRLVYNDFEVAIDDTLIISTKPTSKKSDVNLHYDLKTPNTRVNNFKDICFIEDSNRVLFSKICTLTHHLEILAQIQIDIQIFADNERCGKLKNYKGIFISGINSKKNNYETLYFRILGYFKQFKEKTTITTQFCFSYSNFLKNYECSILNFIIENDDEFYIYLKMYINENLHND
ncbi:hypothetical protein COBT_003308, partial [Conglomerata obtusa]